MLLMTRAEFSTDWNAAAFARSLVASQMSLREIREALLERGFSYHLESIRRWTQDGSAGPKHPAVRVELAQILEASDI